MELGIWSELFGKENKWMKKWWYSALFGLLGGFTTMIGNAAGPVLSVYLLSMRKDKMEYIGINAWFFLVVNLLKVPLQIFVWDNISWDTFSLNLAMLPIIGIGAWLGIGIVKLFPEKAFRPAKISNIRGEPQPAPRDTRGHSLPPRSARFCDCDAVPR